MNAEGLQHFNVTDLGALVGGLLGDLLFGVGVTGFNLSSFIVAVAGSLLLMLLGRAFYNRRTI